MTRTTQLASWLLAAVLGCVSFCSQASASLAPSSAVAPRNALADAKSIAAQYADSQVMRIAGSSMHPFFGEGALVVVKKIDSAKLRAGMVVVYTNRFGEKVVHRLLANRADGWVAKGYNNAREDSTLVNASNLVGVVYATFFTQAADLKQLASDSSLAAVEVALAAPAK